VVGERKLVGSAQLREGSAFLQHGSLLLENGQDIVARITRGTAPRVVATSLGEVLSRPVAFEDVADVIAQQARETWPGHWSESKASPPVDGIDMFESWDWTWRL
jgi:lipoate-protein ligase A